MEPVVQDDAVDAQRVAGLLDVVDSFGDREGFRRVALDAMTRRENPLPADDGAAAHRDLPGAQAHLDAHEARPIGDAGGFALDDAQIAARARPAGGRGAGRLRPSLRPLDNRSERGWVALVRREQPARRPSARARRGSSRSAEPSAPMACCPDEEIRAWSFPLQISGALLPRMIAWRCPVDLEASAPRQTCRSSNPPLSC